MIKCRLRILLAEKEMNQKELAQATGVQPMTINKMYHNQSKQVSLTALDKICEVLECNVNDIFQRVEK